MQDQLNDADTFDIFLVDILPCYWNPDDGKLMLWITGLSGLGEDVMKAEDMKFYYSDTLVLFILRTRIGVNKYRENRNFRAAKEWREWVMRFINGKKKLIPRLVRIFGNNLLEEILGYQVNIAML